MDKKHIQADDLDENQHQKLAVFCPFPQNGQNIEITITRKPLGIFQRNFLIIFFIHIQVHVFNSLEIK